MLIELVQKVGEEHQVIEMLNDNDHCDEVMHNAIETIKAGDLIILMTDHTDETWISIDGDDIGYKQIETVDDLQEYFLKKYEDFNE